MKSLFQLKSFPNSERMPPMPPKPLCVTSKQNTVSKSRIRKLGVPRAKERALSHINGSHEDAYRHLLKYCQEIERSNPGSTVKLEINPATNQFKRLFICFAASAMGFAYCRPILGLDGTHLKHKYQGIKERLMFLIDQAFFSLPPQSTPKVNCFPLAHAVVDIEDHDNWHWFLELLLTVVQAHVLQALIEKALVLLSDRQKGLLQGVTNVFPGCPHAYCMKHLEKNFHQEFKNVELKQFLWQAAKATTQPEFDQALENMRKTNPKSVTWLLEHAGSEHWAELYFSGHRYGHYTSNIAESLNAWLLEAREKPIFAMLEHIHQQLMRWFSERRGGENHTPGLLVSNSTKYLQVISNNRAHRYIPVPSTSHLYEVKSNETSSNYIVNLENQTCSCQSWQSTGYPCGHAICVLLHQGKDPQMYVKSFFTILAYQKTYEAPIFPPLLENVTGDAIHSPPTISTDEDASGSDNDAMLPPATHRPARRPKKRRIRAPTEDLDREKCAFKCSRCGESGHSKRTCQAAINALD